MKEAFVDGWMNYFTALAGLSATIFSVMFVTFQIRPEFWRYSRLRSAAAASALGELLVALFMSLIGLMAGHPWRVAALISGSFGIVVILAHWYFFVLDHVVADDFDRNQAKLGWLSLAFYATIFVSGFLEPSPGLYIITGICTWLLFSGASEAAWLLMSHQEYTQDAERKVFTREFCKWVDGMRNRANREVVREDHSHV